MSLGDLLTTRNEFTQLLGRHTWFVIHATAAAVKSEDDIHAFVCFMHALVNSYPCKRCRQNIRLTCSENISRLRLLAVVEGQPCNFSAVVWAAQLHACVTRHVHEAQQAGEANAWVSCASVNMAARVLAATPTEVYAMVQKFKNAI
jgi:hypothetical protein